MAFVVLFRFAILGAEGLKGVFGETGGFGDDAVVPFGSGGGAAVEGLAGAHEEFCLVGHGGCGFGGCGWCACGCDGCLC